MCPSLSSYLFFIAKRISFSQEDKKKILSPSVCIAIISMALGLIVMILSIAIVVGFKKEVRNKIIGFGSHIQITSIRNRNLYEAYPMTVHSDLLNRLKSIPNIRHVQRFTIKPAIIKTEDNFQGILLKGVDRNFDWNFFKQNLIEGDLPSPSSLYSVLLSKDIAEKLHLKVKDNFYCYFIQDPIRVRKYCISGIYQTNFINYDQLFVLCDMEQILRLNDWDEDMVSGLEILINDYSALEKTTETVCDECSGLTDRLGNHYSIRSIKQINPMIFAWLDVLDINVVVILVLMLLIAGFSMISGLLVIILERSNMIGILKAMGENNIGIRKIFLYLSVFLIGKGFLWGNIVALSLCFIQKYSGIFKLDPNVYYVSEVPIHLSLLHWFLINFGMLVITLLMLIAPSCLVAKILPAKTLRFE